jgi:hypothetical protein
MAAMLFGAVASAALSGLMVALPSTDRLGVDGFWSWFLTGLQVLSLAAIARGRPAAWLLGATVQISWVTYAVLTAQHGFIPGCVLSLAVQVNSYLRTSGAVAAAGGTGTDGGTGQLREPLPHPARPGLPHARATADPRRARAGARHRGLHFAGVLHAHRPGRQPLAAPAGARPTRAG